MSYYPLISIMPKSSPDVVPTFITTRTIGQTFTINCSTTTSYFKLTTSAGSTVYPIGANTITVNTSSGKYKLESCTDTGVVSGSFFYVRITNSSINFFDSTGLVITQELRLSNNLLTSFSASNLTQLTRLTLDNNLLTSFSATGLSSVNYLTMNNNSLTTFNSGTMPLFDAFLNNNSLTSATFNSQAGSIGIIHLHNNLLMTLTINANLGNLYEVDVSNNSNLSAASNDALLIKMYGEAIYNAGLLNIASTPNMQRTSASNTAYTQLTANELAPWTVIGTYTVI